MSQKQILTQQKGSMSSQMQEMMYESENEKRAKEIKLNTLNS